MNFGKFFALVVSALFVLALGGCKVSTLDIKTPNGDKHVEDSAFERKETIDTNDQYKECMAEARNQVSAYGMTPDMYCRSQTGIPLNGGSMMGPGAIPFTAGVSLGGMSPNAYGPVTLPGYEYNTVDPQLAAMRDMSGTAGLSNASAGDEGTSMAEVKRVVRRLDGEVNALKKGKK